MGMRLLWLLICTKGDVRWTRNGVETFTMWMMSGGHGMVWKHLRCEWCRVDAGGGFEFAGVPDFIIKHTATWWDPKRSQDWHFNSWHSLIDSVCTSCICAMLLAWLLAFIGPLACSLKTSASIAVQTGVRQWRTCCTSSFCVTVKALIKSNYNCQRCLVWNEKDCFGPLETSFN